MWDHEVDVLCVGGLVGALASAVVAADEGVDVLVAVSDDDERAWPAGRVTDEETLEYFAALTDGLPTEPLPTDDVPVRPVRPLTAAERRDRKVAPFYGGRLRKWTEQCLLSPYGLLHTRVSDWRTTTMRTLDDRPVQVKVVGRVTLPAGGGAVPLATWLNGEARMRDIDMRGDARLQRIVFEEGVVVGAVFDTADGLYAVRARHGITLAPHVAHTAAADYVRGEDEAEVALVSEIGSRFARVELLAAAPPPAAIPPATCSSSNRRLPKTLRESRRNRSETRRSREVNGHPPFGQ
ncbi:hypothetical protein [Mycolicibacterium litorale]|uniref:FAD-dependent oxidoreductase 2 FAD binding domain-containing protein n=1 Tax=Mycolicibacterium litorale TaxID=758802 RepID=A0AAD1MS77_9MYCO|nr:hypothetical protein [Mycolicibacterium litorale]MCV7415749.1 hypothetical protein [Mycolicibacterium litorale]TDY09003.1 hypothetical protein BCL50_1080 [Mycolicibacterium litorale]BBY16934.1 hypothetical protein MLIT_25260 [Mycolicibacterium litorale]